MKCKKCGFIINENDAKCPGCDTNVEELKEKNYIIYEEKSEEYLVEEGQAPTLINDEMDSTEDIEIDIEESTDTDEPKNNNVINIIIILIIIMIVVLFAVYIFLDYTKPSSVINRSIDKILYNLPKEWSSKSNLDIEFNYISDIESDYINTVSFTSDLYYDNSSYNKVNNIVVKDTFDTITSTIFVENNDGLFIYNSDIYDQYIKIDKDLVSNYEYTKQLKAILNQGDIKKVIKEMKKVISSITDDKDYKKEYTTITYNEKNMGTTKSVYKIDESKIKKATEKFMTSVKKNNNIINYLMNIWETDKEDVLNRLASYCDFSNLEIELYTDYFANSIYKLELTFSADKDYHLTLDLGSSSKISTLTYTIDNKTIILTDDLKTINVIDDDGFRSKFVYSYKNSSHIPHPDIIEYVEYDETIDAAIKENISNNETLARIYDILINKNNLSSNIDNELILELPIDSNDETILEQDKVSEVNE